MEAQNRGAAMMSRSMAGLAAFLVGGAVGAAQAQQLDVSGRWSLSGLIAGNGIITSFAQICDLTQTGNQFAGQCHGPNGGCAAVGVVTGVGVDLTCRTTNTNNPSLSGVLTAHGALAGDQIVRGACTHSRAPGVSGQFAMMRI
jgi:hypothetical protein